MPLSGNLCNGKNNTAFSIDGNGGAVVGQQPLYLWSSNNSNVNQQWELTRTEADSPSTSNAGNSVSINTAFDDDSGHGSYPSTNVIDGNTDFSSR